MAQVHWFLVKMPVVKANKTLVLAGSGTTVCNRPLFQHISPQVGVGLTTPPIWHIIEAPIALDAKYLWNVCHAIVTHGLRLAGWVKPEFAEPDFQQRHSPSLGSCTSRRVRKTLSATIMLCSVLIVTACTPTLYRSDISAFSKGVDEAATAFDGLHARTLAKYKKERMDTLAKNGAVVSVVSDACTDSVSKQLPKDVSCLAEWAAFRATQEGKRGFAPTCAGASGSIRGGEYIFYDLASLARKEAETCRLGVLKPDGSVDPTPLDDVEVLLTNAPKLLPGLKAYAAALVGIADASDRDALQGSVGKAKEQVTQLGARIDGLDGKSSPFVSTIGPVSDLVGAVLIAGLEQRRYDALVAVTKGADPIVIRAATLLSNAAMPMTEIELLETGPVFLKSLPDRGRPPTGDAWVIAYGNAREARERYLAIFATSPTSVFKAMADAHHELALALSDPKRQYESLKSAIEEFSNKAKAAYDAFEKARADDQKAKAEAAR